jgi:hypothetical protein
MKTNTPDNLLAALNVEKANMNTYLTQLGFSSADLDECTDDQANLEVALENVQLATQGKEAVTEIKDAVYNGDADEAINAYPPFAIVALPVPGVKGGALARYNNRKKRAKLAAGYTAQIATAMGYDDAEGEKIADADLVAEMKVSPVGNYTVQFVFSKQGTNGMRVEWRYAGTTNPWDHVDSYSSSPATAQMQPSTPGQPAAIDFRCRLLRKNQPVGQWSPTYTIYVTP